MTREELLAKLRALKPWLEDQGLSRVRLFGSYARDEAGPASDVDLLVEVSRPLSQTWGVYDVEEMLARNLGLKVQLVFEDRLTNPYIRHTAERDAVVV